MSKNLSDKLNIMLASLIKKNFSVNIALSSIIVKPRIEALSGFFDVDVTLTWLKLSLKSQSTFPWIWTKKNELEIGRN